MRGWFAFEHGRLGLLFDDDAFRFTDALASGRKALTVDFRALEKGKFAFEFRAPTQPEHDLAEPPAFGIDRGEDDAPLPVDLDEAADEDAAPLPELEDTAEEDDEAPRFDPDDPVADDAAPMPDPDDTTEEDDTPRLDLGDEAGEDAAPDLDGVDDDDEPPALDPGDPALGVPANPGPGAPTETEMILLEAFEQRVFELTNEFRAENGLSPLANAPTLNAAAEDWSRQMAEDDFFAHSSPSHVEDFGYSWRHWGENIAGGQSSPEAVVQAWITSPGHRANILNETYEEIGIGYYHLPDDTGDVNYNYYWTQIFATEANALL